MAKRTAAKTPPKERKRIDGDGCFTIVTVDREKNTVSLDVGGYSVTLNCSPQSNLDLYRQIKTILVDTIVAETFEDKHIAKCKL